MKKSFFVALTLVVTVSMSFTAFFIPDKSDKRKLKPTCVCETPTFIAVTRSGDDITFEWTAINGAEYYKFGGYYSSGGGFSYCETGTSKTIPYNGGGTAQIRAICDGTCDNATCSSNPSSPRSF